MSVQNEYDPGVPLVYVEQALNANPQFVREFGDALYEPVRIPREPPDSYIIVKAGKPRPRVFGGVREYIGQVEATVDVINIRTYPLGTGSEIFFSETIKLLRRVLCGNINVDVRLKGKKIGTVDATTFINEVGLTANSKGNFDTLHKGITFNIVWR